MNRTKALRWSRRLSMVPRWTVMPVIRRQNVAEHCFHVAQTVRWLCDMHANDSWAFRLQCIISALDHDLDEAVTGDNPSPRQFKIPPTKNDQTKVVVKCADLLEALAFVQEEELFGNSYGVDEIKNFLVYELHEWWTVFKYREKSRPLTSDLICEYLETLVPVDGSTKHMVLE